MDPTLLNININNNKIQQVQFIKFLGIIIDEHLTWDHHIRYITGKIAKITGILCKARHKLNRTSLRMLYIHINSPLHNILFNNMGKDIHQTH